MKKILLLLFLLVIVSCEPQGTLKESQATQNQPEINQLYP